MPTYRTPGVYIEEISRLPPAVAEVETAIPAFIGYTGCDTLITAGDMLRIPKRIQSLLEFEACYGGESSYTVTRANIDQQGNFLSTEIRNRYYLYDSLRLFYDNGGGDCYIVCVGRYKTTPPAVHRDALIAGLQAVAGFDEPTILLFPDAAILNAEDLAAVQQAALAQCGALRDRVAVLDLRRDDPDGTVFRDKIGSDNLKYGAAYTPWLQLSYHKRVGYAQVRDCVRKNGTPQAWDQLTTEKATLTALQTLDHLIDDNTTLAAAVSAHAGANETLSSRFDRTLATFNAKAAPVPADIAPLFRYIFGIARVIDRLVDATPLNDARLVADINAIISGMLAPAMSRLIALEKAMARDLRKAGGTYTAQWSKSPPKTDAWGGIFGARAPAASGDFLGGATLGAIMGSALPGLQAGFVAASSAIDSIESSIDRYRGHDEQALYDSFIPYRNVVNGVRSALALCPPSGAIAGVYAAVDRQRGVWKAPANISLNSVIAPVSAFTASAADALNVDAVSGKSINAIRTFVGKGTLVWGARTLAGNDNEWRYVPVRRFFNMVEESTRKSTCWAVFEPNDANTWARVRGMIENYLTEKWRQGALAGSTPEDAFFVRCGLGMTMSAQDILEGRMNVEIGMAVVRPAEFIILKFSHQLLNS